jgi:Zn-dependent protease with chaperone function
MTFACLMGFGIDANKFMLISLSLSFAVVILFALKRFALPTKARISLIYSHLFFLLFPLAIYSINLGCGLTCMPCYNNMFVIVLYALPTAILSTTLVGFFVIPMLYTFSNKKRHIRTEWMAEFVNKHSKNLRIKPPKLYAINKARPLAFSFRSFRSAIFLSVGLLEMLSKKEIMAVLLHELAHIKQRSSVMKFSHNLLRVFSPLSLLTRFHFDSNAEETGADDFAIRAMGSDRYILSAKRKLNEYENSDS